MRKRSPLEDEFYNSTVYHVANKVMNEVEQTVSTVVDEVVENTSRTINININRKKYNRVNPPDGNYKNYNRYNQENYSQPNQGSYGGYNQPNQGSPGSYSQPNQGSCGSYNQPNQGNPGRYGQPNQGSYGGYNQPNQGNPGSHGQPNQGSYGSYNQPNQGSYGSYNQPNQGSYGRPNQGSYNSYNRGSGPSYPRRPVPPPPKPPKPPVPKKVKEKKGMARFIVSGIFIVLGTAILPVDSFIGVAVLVGIGIGGYHLGRYFTKSTQKYKALTAAKKQEKERQRLLEEQRKAAEKAAEEAARKAQEEKARRSTGNPELDAIIAEGDEYIAKLRAANDAIEHEGVSASIDRMEAASKGIFEYIKDNPSKIPQIRKFMNYYLPTTLKLLNSYERLSKQAVKGDNISSTMFDIEGMMHTIACAFEKQLDGLFSSDAMDIQADIEVFETILTQEGLKDEETKTGN